MEHITFWPEHKGSYSGVDISSGFKYLLILSSSHKNQYLTIILTFSRCHIFLAVTVVIYLIYFYYNLLFNSLIGLSYLEEKINLYKKIIIYIGLNIKMKVLNILLIVSEILVISYQNRNN